MEVHYPLEREVGGVTRETDTRRGRRTLQDGVEGEIGPGWTCRSLGGYIRGRSFKRILGGVGWGDVGEDSGGVNSVGRRKCLVYVNRLDEGLDQIRRRHGRRYRPIRVVSTSLLPPSLHLT